MPLRPTFRLVGVEQISRWGTEFAFLAGLDGDPFVDSVKVRVECRPQPGAPWGALSYVLEPRGPRAPRSLVETHACSVARWLAVGEGAPA
jgi:hypothetical protein